MKKNFKLDTRVKIVRVGSDQLENAYGLILGKSAVFAEDDFYIVMLDIPLPDTKAVVITEHCLEAV